MFDLKPLALLRMQAAGYTLLKVHFLSTLPVCFAHICVLFVDTTFGLGISVISEGSSKNKFLRVLWSMHFVDSATLPAYMAAGYDPLAKVRPFLNHVLKKCHAHWDCGPDVAGDESRVPMKVKNTVFAKLMQYNANKPQKHAGILDTAMHFGLLKYFIILTQHHLSTHVYTCMHTACHWRLTDV